LLFKEFEIKKIGGT